MTALGIGVVMVIGLAGTLLPILPGLGLIWAAALVYGFVEGFGPVGWAAFALITGVGATAVAAGIRVPQRAAAVGGIDWKGQLLALGLAVVGFFVIPVLGAAVGFVVGIFLVARRKHGDRAWEITRSTVKALLLAAGLQFAAGLGMIGLWLAWVVIA
ncbi:MAG TPA: DUF456 domain-containing protein [Acidimicrobiia bacterium]|nr:DUF456 domain-containing protein [Acidimicrobiia bacterium]